MGNFQKTHTIKVLWCWNGMTEFSIDCVLFTLEIQITIRVLDLITRRLITFYFRDYNKSSWLNILFEQYYNSTEDLVWIIFKWVKNCFNNTILKFEVNLTLKFFTSDFQGLFMRQAAQAISACFQMNPDVGSMWNDSARNTAWLQQQGNYIWSKKKS